MDAVTTIIKAAKLLDRQVWCRLCGHTERIGNGLRDGWPKCCSQTMTIDPPETWKK